MPVTLLYASILAVFALVLSSQAGGFRGKYGVSVLFGDPANMELAERSGVTRTSSSTYRYCLSCLARSRRAAVRRYSFTSWVIC